MGNHLQDLFGSNKEGEETWGASWQMQAPSEEGALQDAGLPQMEEEWPGEEPAEQDWDTFHPPLPITLDVLMLALTI
jgi:hypothetical protein